MQLYKISDKYLSLLNENNLGFENEMDAMDCLEKLEKAEGEFKEKAKNVCAYILNLEAELDSVKEVEKRIQRRRKALEKKVEYLRDYVVFHMHKMEISEIKADDFSFNIKICDGRESVEIINEEGIDDMYFNFTKTPNKKLIGIAIKDGEKVEGCCLVRRPYLMIK